MFGLITGSGFYDIPDLVDRRVESVPTAFGSPVTVTLGSWSGNEVCFIPRHGSDHSIPPHAINYRANVAALKTIGATSVLATAVSGAINPDMPPGSLVLISDFLNFSSGRQVTFFDGSSRPIVEHRRYRLVERGATDEDLGETGIDAQAERGAHRGAPQIAIDEQDASTRLHGRYGGQADRGRRLAVASPRARHRDAAERTRGPEGIDAGAQRPKLLGHEGLRLQQRDTALVQLRSIADTDLLAARAQLRFGARSRFDKRRRRRGCRRRGLDRTRRSGGICRFLDSLCTLFFGASQSIVDLAHHALP